MNQTRANTPAPIKANLMTEQLSVQMSWGNGGCTRAGSPGDQQSRELGPWAARRSRAMMRANAWGHDELKKKHFSNIKRLQPCHYFIVHALPCRLGTVSPNQDRAVEYHKQNNHINFPSANFQTKQQFHWNMSPRSD